MGWVNIREGSAGRSSVAHMSLRRGQWCFAILLAIYAVHVSGEDMPFDSPAIQTSSLYMAAVQATARLLKGRRLQQVVNINGSPFSNPCVTGGQTFCPIVIKKSTPSKSVAASAPAPGPQVALAPQPLQAG